MGDPHRGNIPQIITNILYRPSDMPIRTAFRTVFASWTARNFYLLPIDQWNEVALLFEICGLHLGDEADYAAYCKRMARHLHEDIDWSATTKRYMPSEGKGNSECSWVHVQRNVLKRYSFWGCTDELLARFGTHPQDDPQDGAYHEIHEERAKADAQAFLAQSSLYYHRGMFCPWNLTQKEADAISSSLESLGFAACTRIRKIIKDLGDTESKTDSLKDAVWDTFYGWKYDWFSLLCDDYWNQLALIFLHAGLYVDKENKAGGSMHMAMHLSTTMYCWPIGVDKLDYSEDMDILMAQYGVKHTSRHVIMQKDVITLQDNHSAYYDAIDPHSGRHSHQPCLQDRTLDNDYQNVAVPAGLVAPEEPSGSATRDGPAHPHGCIIANDHRIASTRHVAPHTFDKHHKPRISIVITHEPIPSHNHTHQQCLSTLVTSNDPARPANHIPACDQFPPVCYDVGPDHYFDHVSTHTPEDSGSDASEYAPEPENTPERPDRYTFGHVSPDDNVVSFFSDRHHGFSVTVPANYDISHLTVEAKVGKGNGVARGGEGCVS